MRFYSSSISSLQDFKDYVKAKGYEAKAFDILSDGYYAYFIKGECNAIKKDFTQINSITPCYYEWARLSFADCTNKDILNA